LFRRLSELAHDEVLIVSEGKMRILIHTFYDWSWFLDGKLGLTPLLAAVYVGALQNIFNKSAKYSLFDPCKEMAYIPLDEDTKV